MIALSKGKKCNNTCMSILDDIEYYWYELVSYNWEL